MNTNETFKKLYESLCEKDKKNTLIFLLNAYIENFQQNKMKEIKKRNYQHIYNSVLEEKNE